MRIKARLYIMAYGTFHNTMTASASVTTYCLPQCPHPLHRPSAVHPRFSLPACLLLFLLSISPSLSSSFHASLLSLLSLSPLSLDMTVILRYNSHRIQFTYVKCAIGWFLVYSQSCTTSTTINFKIYSSLWKEIAPISICSLCAPQP